VTIEQPIRASAGHRLALKATSEGGLVLHDDGSSPVGRITDAIDGPTVLEDADGVWWSTVVKHRLRWQAVAHRRHCDLLVAAYYPSWRSGGRVWVSSDNWYALRTWRGAWSLSTSDKRPVAQLHSPRPSELEIELLDNQPALSLLMLFSCWLVLIECAMPVIGGGEAI
jgi:hypothetical protein